MDVQSDHRKLVTTSFLSHLHPSQNNLDTICTEEPEFQQGLLLQTIEKGVKYPIVHFGPVKYYYGLENEQPKCSTRKIHSDSNAIVTQGFYQELASVRVDLFGSALDDIKGVTRDVTWNKFYMLLGFHQLPFRPFTETTEVHWKDWSLARYLFLNIPDDFGLSGLTFYKRQQPDDYSLFLYMVLVECAHIRPREQLHLKDFINRVRADKLPSYMALYQEASSDHTWRPAELEVCHSKKELKIPSPMRSSTPIAAHRTDDVRITSQQQQTQPHRQPARSSQTRGTSPLPTPWFFISHPQFLRRNQRQLQRSGDLDSVGESEMGSLSMSTEGRSSASPSTPFPYHWSEQHFDQF